MASSGGCCCLLFLEAAADLSGINASFETLCCWGAADCFGTGCNFSAEPTGFGGDGDAGLLLMLLSASRDSGTGVVSPVVSCFGSSGGDPMLRLSVSPTQTKLNQHNEIRHDTRNLLGREWPTLLPSISVFRTRRLLLISNELVESERSLFEQNGCVEIVREPNIE